MTPYLSQQVHSLEKIMKDYISLIQTEPDSLFQCKPNAIELEVCFFLFFCFLLIVTSHLYLQKCFRNAFQETRQVLTNSNKNQMSEEEENNIKIKTSALESLSTHKEEKKETLTQTRYEYYLCFWQSRSLVIYISVCLL